MQSKEEISTYLSNHEKGQLVKQQLIEEYSTINNFDSKLFFWLNNQDFLKWRGFEKSELSLEYEELARNHFSHHRMNEINYIFNKEDIKNGIFEPIPQTDDEKVIYIKRYIDFCGYSGKSFELLRDDFLNKIKEWENTDLFLEKEKEHIITELDETINIVINHELGKTVKDLVSYFMGKKNFDYLFFYNEYRGKYNFPDIVVSVAHTLPLLQFQKFLENYSTPPSQGKVIGEGDNERNYPAIVVMAAAQIIDKVKGEEFLPPYDTEFEKRVGLTITAISNKLNITVGNGIRNYFNPYEKLSKDQEKKVAELLREKGYEPQAKRFELEKVATNR
jgi:hypothetical protein